MIRVRSGRRTVFIWPFSFSVRCRSARCRRTPSGRTPSGRPRPRSSSGMSTGVYARLAEVRSETEAMRDRGYQLAHGADREAIFEQAQMLIERDVMVQYANKVLQSLDAEHEGLGVRPARPGRYGGARLRSSTSVGSGYVTRTSTIWCWTGGRPRPSAFYQATAEHRWVCCAAGVIRCSRERVLDHRRRRAGAGRVARGHPDRRRRRAHGGAGPGARRPDARHRGHDPEGAGRRDPGAVGRDHRDHRRAGHRQDRGSRCIARPTCCIGTAAR